MIQSKRWMPYAVGCALCLSVVGFLRTPNKVSAAVRAALVEVVIPTQTFHGTMIATNYPTALGPTSGTLGITTLTLTNFDTTTQQVYLFQPVLSGTGCYNTIVGTVDTGLRCMCNRGRRW